MTHALTLSHHTSATPYNAHLAHLVRISGYPVLSTLPDQNSPREVLRARTDHVVNKSSTVHRPPSTVRLRPPPRATTVLHHLGSNKDNNGKRNGVGVMTTTEVIVIGDAATRPPRERNAFKCSIPT